MKHLLILILISLLLLSSPVIGEETLPVSGGKGVTLYEWVTSSGKVWKYFGDKTIQTIYKGEVENGVPNGLGIQISPHYPDGSYWGLRYVGEYKDGEMWNVKGYDKNSDIRVVFENGKPIKQQ